MLLQELTWPEVGRLSRDLPVVVPLAALEQHGGHLPVFTDSMLLVVKLLEQVIAWDGHRWDRT